MILVVLVDNVSLAIVKTILVVEGLGTAVPPQVVALAFNVSEGCVHHVFKSGISVVRMQIVVVSTLTLSFPVPIVVVFLTVLVGLSKVSKHDD